MKCIDCDAEAVNDFPHCDRHAFPHQRPAQFMEVDSGEVEYFYTAWGQDVRWTQSAKIEFDSTVCDACFVAIGPYLDEDDDGRAWTGWTPCFINTAGRLLCEDCADIEDPQPPDHLLGDQ